MLQLLYYPTPSTDCPDHVHAVEILAVIRTSIYLPDQRSNLIVMSMTLAALIWQQASSGMAAHRDFTFPAGR
jgi:hypothetical protein